ncbi:hypothetical protein EKL30_16985 [Candidimonas sp. SYP-B2681]|uniref:hypothetical protein n=1 Tax=Candidimonas sp. SYP-B2681 TaxID=2497686 RepID=UPI000F864D1A|nr:hypothetical protein [Candidimonas sp. SYP-B2681]RTZ39953.1 hypothetical protein EKL30_16985 [Candidimonas sp. SYP-B2681]
MSKAMNPANELANSLIPVLGLPQNVTRLVLTLNASKPPPVECEFIPEARNAGDGFAQVAGKFHLVPVGGTLSPTDTVGHPE